ncbi:MAG: hypothetical protein Q9172_001375 [Xanthocarpia lactea]
MASVASQLDENIDEDQEELKPEERGTDASAPVTSTPPHPPSTPRILKRASTTSLIPTTSSTNSPKPSRETSPVRPPLRSGVTANSANPRSRKNSTDLSPNRGPALPGPIVPAVPSAAAIQRALSVAGAHQLQPSTTLSDPSIDPVKPQKVIKTALANNNQSASNLPRVRSPPPSNSNKGTLPQPRRPDQVSAPSLTPTIVIDRPNRAQTSATDSDASNFDAPAPAGMRIPGRGASGSQPALETVQESSVPSTPALGPAANPEGTAKATPDKRPDKIEENSFEDDAGKDHTSRQESGNESGDGKHAPQDDEKDTRQQDLAKASAVKPQVIHPKRSTTQLHPAKGKTGAEGSVKSMTVETETVSSIPQVALGGGAGDRGLPGRTDTGGSLRLKPSTETIRPKKEKKRVVRKAPSLNAGTGGLPSSRRFHHHHLFSRPPSPEQGSFRSSNLPEPVPALVPDTSDTESSLQSPDLVGTCWPKASSDSRPPYPETLRRYSVSTLTKGRGRVASSKSDIFEAKVASAVDEANSSDSGETFVYESNPPEPLSARPHRYHSRTPSATSMASQVDHYGPRARQDGHHSIAGKKSMKFANNSYHSTNLPEAGETGTVRGPPSNRGTPSHHRHIGQFGRNGGHTSLFDSESPFPNAAKPLGGQAGNAARLSPRPSSPREPHLVKVSGSNRKAREPLSYDMEGEGADDERTPLIGSARSGRSRISRRVGIGSSRNGYPAEDEKRRRTCRAVTVYSSLATLMTALIAAVVIIMVFCSKPLMEVRIRDIRNVLASEQELMLDLHVHAINPNLVAVQVGDLDINIFAKSKHVGTNEMWRDRGHRRLPRSRAIATEPAGPTRPDSDTLTENGTGRSIHTADGIDEGTDPMPDPETDSQTMLLGRIFEFDSPLIFDPSPLHHTSLSSLGEVRLAHPGNKTEEGGSSRWETVIQYDFELIVRGVVKYTLPLSSTKRKASVGASVVVRPGLGIDSETGSMVVLLVAFASADFFVMALTRAQGRKTTDRQSDTQEKPLKSAGKKRARDEVKDDNTGGQDQKASTATTTKKRKSAPNAPVDDSIKAAADKFLTKYGSLPLNDLGLPNPTSADRENVLALIYNAMLTSTRISHQLAFKSVKCLIEAGYQDIDTLTSSTWEERTEVLTRGGYTRYREKTATALEELAHFVETKYDGDLNNLLSKANAQPVKVRQLIKEIKGIGNVGVDIFCDTAQGIWPCLAPFIDPRSMKTANECGLGEDIERIWDAIGKDPEKMCKLAAALTTVRLEKREQEFV